MKIILLFLILCNVAFSEQFKTEPQAIETIDTPDDHRIASLTNRYTFAIPKDFKTEHADFTSMDFMIVNSTTKKSIFNFSDVPPDKVSFNPKIHGLDYTRREFISAIYDKSHNSNKDIVNTRKLIFDDSNNITVYKRDGFLFFREDRKDGNINIKIASPVNDDILMAIFHAKDESLILNFIKSLKPIE